MNTIILEMKNIVKEFPGVKALNNVNFKVEQNSIHALVGENGAGKSTLMNVLSGLYGYGTYTGEIMYEGTECRFKNIHDSEKKGIVIIHQELALVPYLSIAENMFLGNETAKNGVINWHEAHRRAKEMLQRVGLNESPESLIKDIGVGKQQLVEIAKALAKDVKLLILDEPTAALNDDDSEKLLKLLLELKKEGLTSIIISHKLNEIEQISDAITILRDGATIETLYKGKDDLSQDRIIKGMVGREMSSRYPGRQPKIGEVCFEVTDWNVFHPLYEGKQVIKDFSFNVRKGEVVGIAGLMGAGRTELAMSLFGKSYGKKISGTVRKNGKELSLNNVAKAIENGIVYLTEDRKTAGLILIDDIKTNICIASLKKISSGLVVDSNKEIKAGEEYVDKINIKCSSVFQKTGTLSGGNQQKVMLARWIYSDPEVLILDEPTRGIDVGSKYEIYTIINSLVERGLSVVMISSELPEILGMCDRVYVMNEGRLVGEVDTAEASQEKIMEFIMKDNREASKYGKN